MTLNYFKITFKRENVNSLLCTCIRGVSMASFHNVLTRTLRSRLKQLTDDAKSVVAADNPCKQFGPRSGSIMFDTLMVPRNDFL